MRILITILGVTLIASCDQKIKTEYYPDGNTRSRGYYVNGSKIGLWKMYNQFGDLNERLFYQNDSLILKETLIEGKINSKQEIKDQKRHGLLVTYFDNGQISTIATYEKGVQQGSVVAYHENGNVNVVSAIKDGIPFGPFIQFHPNGIIHVYAKESGNSVYEIYDQDGIKEYSILYEAFEEVDTLYSRY
ncbi:MAG: hypothetical protein RJQ09_13280 [Cyclobacteriaceae bacterium]